MTAAISLPAVEEWASSMMTAKPLIFQALHAVHDIGELLDGGGDDFCVTVQRNRKVSRIALVIHHADKASLMLHTHNGLLELPVYNNTVGDDDHVIKDDFIVSIVETTSGDAPAKRWC